ncbi:YqeG family HAD IIIA-type phosphatase [Mycoplasma marinum]|uniref:YqeG family HAD IIIA-type phosphatase n=1 Tax=Mycoplasma marinum TaxID=1937190 RepID=A0A4R0XPG3_9MOLU|nr:YqeG family HAD IIIA-type phosphatase [Mycoplasma marinum]TCG10785.1 YqeG family HAD IIIA-type phosphatase [Mycoplasma marinum]
MQNNKHKKGLIVNYFKPSIYVRSFKDVNLNLLKEQGIKMMICDLDNTLVPHYTRFPNKEVLRFLEAVKQYGIKFVVVSNNTKKRVSVFCNKAKIKHYKGNAKKPLKSSVLNIMKESGFEPKETIIMGDMIITDILIANRMKIESILVQPLVSTDYKMSATHMFLENVIYKKLEKKNILKRGQYSSGHLETSFELL